MINRKKFLGKVPELLGDKDAVHAPIVAVRAANYLEVGCRVKLNKHNEAIKGSDRDYLGVVDPFLDKDVRRGGLFWMVVRPDKVGEVSHTWVHENVKVNFEAPTRPVQLNETIKDYAAEFGCSYPLLMEALSNSYKSRNSPSYVGTIKTHGELEEKLDWADSYELWWEWCEEVGEEPENYGSACCPEYDFPSLYNLFEWVDENGKN